MTIMKTKTRKLSKTFNILAIASLAAILLGSITLFSEQAYSSDAGGNLVVYYDFEDGVSPTLDVSGHEKTEPWLEELHLALMFHQH